MKPKSATPSTTPLRHVGMLAALCASVIGLVLLAESANAFDNHQQNPVAGDPQCADLFLGSSQVRSDPPGPDPNPTGTVPAQHLPTVDGFKELVGVIVHGGASGSNVYDTTTGMSGRLVSTRNPGGGLANIDYTLVCYTEHADPTVSTATITLVYSDSGHRVTVSAAVTESATTTTASTTTTPSVPTLVESEIEVSPAAIPVPGQPSFTG